MSLIVSPRRSSTIRVMSSFDIVFLFKMVVVKNSILNNKRYIFARRTTIVFMKLTYFIFFHCVRSIVLFAVELVYDNSKTTA